MGWDYTAAYLRAIRRTMEIERISPHGTLLISGYKSLSGTGGLLIIIHFSWLLLQK